MLKFEFILVAALALAAPVRAEIAPFAEATKEMVIGDPKAPVTIIEYASLGCPHCANFHANAFPQLKKDYIDTGKARLIFRDFPLGTPAMAAAMISRCAGPARYFGFVDMFFRSQQQWSRAENPLLALAKVARFGGMTGDDVNACLKDQTLLDNLQENANKAQLEDEINATPSFLINGKKISGALAYEDFRSLVEDAIKKAQ